MPPIEFQLSNNAAVALSTYENAAGFTFPVIQIPVASAAPDEQGTATFNFTGTNGFYDVAVSYIDESDGTAQISLNVGGALTFDDPMPGNTAITDAALATGVFVSENQEIVLTGTRNGEEFARVGSLTFTPVGVGTVSFDGVTFSANEGDGAATVNLVREGSTEGSISVTVNLADAPATSLAASATAGADYNATPITVTFGDGESTASAIVPLVDDAMVETDEAVVLTLTSGSGNGFVGSTSQAGLVIQDNDVETVMPPVMPPVTPPTTPPTIPPTTPPITPPVTGGEAPDVDDDMGDDDGDVLSDFDSIISGTSASESITGTSQDDIILARGGADVVQGLAGDDTMKGGNGRDLMFGGAGADSLMGGRARDFLNGDSGDDILNGGQARDVINGGSGRDILIGGAGRDVLSGNKGNDMIFGGGGSDILRGNKGNDVMSGGNGRDVLRGGAGADIYRLEVARGVDLFEGFKTGTDTIEIGNGLSFEDLSLTVRGGNTVIRVEDTNQKLAVVLGVDVSDASNFA